MARSPDYQRDGITLYCGDCLEILPEIGPVDAVVTDPPYGIGDRLTRGGTGSGCFTGMIGSGADTWDVAPEEAVFNAPLAMSRHQIIWGGNFFRLPPCHKPLCWDKIRPNQRNTSEWEYAWTSLTGRAQKFDYCGNAGFVSREPRVHPTQKPLPLIAWCLSLLPDCKSVFDPYMGSGTTGVACVQMARRFTGIELERKYFDAAVKRIDAALDTDRDSLWTAKQLAEQQRPLFE